MKKGVYIFMLLIMLISLSGCSAVMAAKGKREANVSALQMGDTKNVVHAKLGYQPLRIQASGNKQIEIYEIEFGNEPSMGRAIAHGTLDLLTIGLWEIVGTPLEATTGEKSYLILEYENGKLVNLQQVSNIKNL